MYKKFFGLTKDPFAVSPDPQFLFNTAGTDKTYASLLYGLRSRKGLILLVGEVGTGKTLLLRKLIEEIHNEITATAFVFNPRLQAAEFLDYVLGDFGIEHNPTDELLAFRTLQGWLLKRHQSGQTSLLIVDEAQDLSREVFEVVHALTNIETPTEKLLQIVLSGQPEIAEILRLPELRTISQRIAVRLRTAPLSHAETLRYIAHRLRVAGGAVETVFTLGALNVVSTIAAGIPRLINLICEHALIVGYADNRRPVGVKTILEIAREFSLGVGSLAEEAFAEEAWGPLDIGLPVPGTGATASLAGAPPLPAPDGPTAMSPATALAIGAEEMAATLAEPALTPPSGESVEPPAPPVNLTPPWAPEVAVGGLGPEAALTPPARESVETPAPAVDLTPPRAPEVAVGGAMPTGIPAGLPMIATESPAEVQASGGDANVVPSTATPPRPPKPLGAGRGVAAVISVYPKPVPKRRGLPPWASLAVAAMGLMIVGYLSFVTGAWKMVWPGRLALLTALSHVSEKTTTGNAPGPPSPSPPMAPGVPRQDHPPAPPATAGHPLVPPESPAGNPARPPTPTSLIATKVPGPARPVTMPLASGPAGTAGQASTVPVRTAREELTAGPLKPPTPSPPVNLPLPGPREVPTHEAPAPPPPLTTGQLAVTSNVAGAAVSLDGQSNPDWTTPHTFKDLPLGVHSIVVSKEGYNAAHQTVTVEAGGEASLNATLTPPRGEIDISTTPPGAEVLIDGKSYGPGPVRAQVDAGQHAFLVRQAGRQPVEGKLDVQNQAVVQRTIALALLPPPPPATNVAVTTQPPSATIYVDGAPMSGKTPASFHLSPGHHTLIIFAEGYRPARREIDVLQDGALTLNVTLSGQ